MQKSTKDDAKVGGLGGTMVDAKAATVQWQAQFKEGRKKGAQREAQRGCSIQLLSSYICLIFF